MTIISDRLNNVSPSQTIAITGRARAMKRAGKDVVSLSAGEPDFDTPRNICCAAKEAIDEGQTHYTDVTGTLALRKAVAHRFSQDHHVQYEPDEILIATGGKQIIFNAIMAAINPGDEAIIPTPCWVSYPDIVTLADGKPVFIQTRAEDNFKCTAQALENAITDKTKWFFINSPCNPTGSVYHRQELRALCDVLLKHPDVWILTDDIYDRLTYDLDEPSQTIVEVEPRLKDRTVTMSGVSKSYAMTGWRIGYCGAPAPLIKAMGKLQGQSTSNPSSISQAAATEALLGPQESVEKMRLTYKERRDKTRKLLSDIPGMTCELPQGAFYLFPSISHFFGMKTAGGKLIKTGQDFTTALLEEKNVAAVHGEAFMCPGYMRISYATAMKNLEEGCRRISEFCHDLIKS